MLKTLLFTLLSFSPVFGATYLSTNSSSNVATSSLTGDLISGLTPTGTGGFFGGDAGASLARLTDDSTATVSSGRVFLTNGTFEYALASPSSVGQIEFKLVNAVVDDRLAFNMTVAVSTNNGGSFSDVATISDPFDNAGGEFATTGILSGIGATNVTNLRFTLTNVGIWDASFSEIDVLPVPEPSAMLLTLMGATFCAWNRRRRP